MAVQIQLRRDTAANWIAANPILAQGELGIETDTSQAKLGDGATAWNSLGYWSAGGAPGSVVLTAGENLSGGNIVQRVGVATSATALAVEIGQPLTTA